jgi:DNA-binding NtrC family response regulator
MWVAGTLKVMSARRTTTRQILLVSSDKQLRGQLRAWLTHEGMGGENLFAVASGHSCQTVVSRIRPRLTVIDDAVTDADGPTLLRTLRRQSPDSLFVYLATRHTAELEREVRQLGVLYYTGKPPDEGSLRKLLVSALGQTLPLKRPPLGVNV